MHLINGSIQQQQATIKIQNAFKHSNFAKKPLNRIVNQIIKEGLEEEYNLKERICPNTLINRIKAFWGHKSKPGRVDISQDFFGEGRKVGETIIYRKKEKRNIFGKSIISYVKEKAIVSYKREQRSTNEIFYIYPESQCGNKLTSKNKKLRLYNDADPAGKMKISKPNFDCVYIDFMVNFSRNFKRKYGKIGESLHQIVAERAKQLKKNNVTLLSMDNDSSKFHLRNGFKFYAKNKMYLSQGGWNLQETKIKRNPILSTTI